MIIFNRWQENHRQEQREALLTACQSNKGQIIFPCGTGKTRIQIALLIGEMIALTKANKSGVFVIASHRLLLNSQLLAQLIDVAVHCGLPFDVLYLGSNRCDLERYYTKYLNLGYTSDVSRHLSTTISKDIERFIVLAKEKNRHCIIASTYDSFDRLKNTGLINITTFDEAHNTTQDNFIANIMAVKDQLIRQYYFTATRKVAGEDGGMNNKDFYGPVLYDAFPYKMISQGEIVSPRMHILKGSNDQTTNTSNTNMLVKNTVEAFSEHCKKVKEVSCNPEEIGAKLLVACNSIDEMMRIYNELGIRALSKKNIKVFALSCNGCYVDWNKCSNREDFFDLTQYSVR